MSITAELSLAGEDCWRDLKTHLEWAEQFELFFLFTDNQLISQIIRQRMEQIYHNHQTPLHYFSPTQATTLIDEVFAFLQPLENPDLATSLRSPIWLELSQYGESWPEQQSKLIQRINERRDRLRKYHPQPFVMVLNQAMASQIQILAPDLWSVRCYSQTLSQDFLILPTAIEVSAQPLIDQLISDEPQEFNTASLKAIEQHPIMQEWRRIEAKGANGIDAFYLGFAAFNLTFAAGFYQISKPIADSLLVMAQQLNQQTGNQTQNKRALSIALNCNGDIAEIFAQPQQAKDFYQQSLARLRQQSLADQPELLRDISIVLRKLGNANQTLGQFEPAFIQYAESLTICRQRQQALGDQPQVLRDISIALERLGNINLALGQFEPALTQYAESLAICRQLQQTLGDQPQVLRDISIALQKLGDVNVELGAINQGLAYYSEALLLATKQQQRLGDQPQVLQDIGVFHIDIGNAHQLAGDQAQAVFHFNESLRFLAQLTTLCPGVANVTELISNINDALAALAQAE